MSIGKTQILVFNRDAMSANQFCDTLSKAGHQVSVALDDRDALALSEQKIFNLILIGIDALKPETTSFMEKVRLHSADTQFILISKRGNVRTAIDAIRQGVFDYLLHPVEPDQLIESVGKALNYQTATTQDSQLRQRLMPRPEPNIFVGGNPAMGEIHRLIDEIAPTDVTVVIQGESGTGKEVIARAIHHNSLRRDHPFVTVDCNTLSENLLESELFGHVKGAFTGAVAAKRGMFEVANQGTLFLDEFGNIPLSTQAKLLRVIQEREFKPVGGTSTLTTNVRLLAATNNNLLAMVGEGRFREDLYYRVNVFPIQAPPLRERREDIPALAFHFLKKSCAELGKPVAEISDGAMSLLVQHDWPGNVRELDNAIERAVILSSDHIIRQANLSDLIGRAAHPDIEVPRTSDELKRLKKVAREKSVEDLEKAFVQETLRRNEHNVTRAAEATGMQRTNFQALMKKYGIRVRDTEFDAGSTDS